MTHIVVCSNRAPAAIGPYSQAIGVGSTLYLSGQIPLDPITMELVGSDIESQTKRVLDNLKAVLEAYGASVKSLVKTTIFLTDLADFPVVNKIYGEYLESPYPARATIGVSALPRGARIEIEGIAVIPSAP